ncbi:MAG: site-specific integrase, partial [Candidatus Helarchaeota archaeon]|nr:site-specific integrase [Candidatus Helarchaeota archaeon]
EQSKEISLQEFFDIFLERHGSYNSNNMQELYRYRFKQICRCPALSTIPIGNITKRLMLDYMHARIKQDRASTATVNREAALVKSMLFRAVEWDIINKNPLQGLKLLPEAEKRKVDLTPKEASELINKLQEPIAGIIEFAIYTGFRKENILSMKIEQIRFHDLTPTGEIELIVKGGRKELYPLSPAAVEIIKRNIGNRKEGYVYPKTGDRFYSIHKGFNTVVRKLGLTVNGTKLRFHDLRHVFATWLHKSGVSLDIVRLLLGHRDRETTDRYITYDPMHYRDVLNTIPKLNRNTKEKVAKNGKNWQGQGEEHMLFLTGKSASN